MSSEKGLKYIYTQEYKLSLLLAVFILEDALFGQTFVVRLVIRLQYKDGHRTHYQVAQQKIVRLDRCVLRPSNDECWPKFILTDKASSTIKTAIITLEGIEKIKTKQKKQNKTVSRIFQTLYILIGCFHRTIICFSLFISLFQRAKNN